MQLAEAQAAPAAGRGEAQRGLDDLSSAACEIQHGSVPFVAVQRPLPEGRGLGEGVSV